MRALARNKQTLYYALYDGLESVTDTDGFYAGQDKPKYSNPVKARMNISTARGEANLEQFGITNNYSLSLVTDDMNCPITETSIVWIDADPEGPHNYVVSRVAKSLNSITYIVRQVDIS